MPSAINKKITEPVPKLALAYPEAAAATGVSENRLRAEANARRLHVKRVGRKVLIPVESLRGWLMDRAAGDDLRQEHVQQRGQAHQQEEQCNGELEHR